MEENLLPGVDGNRGLAGDIFGSPSGGAIEAIELILGDWPRLLFDSEASGSITILTPIAGYMNLLAYFVIVVIMSYVLIAAVIKTAAEGTVLGKGWSSVWLPLRTFLALGMLFPIGVGQAGSISFIQAGVAWLGLVGSNAADEVARFVVNNLSRRGFSLDQNIASFKSIKDMTTMGLCALGLESTSESGRSEDILATASGVNSQGRLARVEGPLSTEMASFHRVDIGNGGHCGSITVNTKDNELRQKMMEKLITYQIRVHDEVVVPLVASSSENSKSPHSERAGHQTYSSMLEGLDRSNSVRERFVTRFNQAVSKQLELINEFEREMNDLLIENLNERNENNKIVFKSDNAGNAMIGINPSFYNEMGWPYLGAYYSLLSASMNEVKKEGANASTSTSPKLDVDGCSIMDSSQGWWSRTFGKKDDSCRFTDVYNTGSLLTGYTDRMIANSGNTLNEIQALCTGRSNCEPGKVESAVASGLASTFMMNREVVRESSTANQARGIIHMMGWGTGVDELGFEDLRGGEVDGISAGALNATDPIAFTSKLGSNMIFTIAIVESFIGAATVLAGGISGAGDGLGILTGGAASAATGALSAGILFATGVVESYLTPLKISAAGMAYFLPLLPSLIWAMAFLSWLLMYAEAIFNAPLAVTLMATPEGEGIAGARMERKIAMVAALVMKPTLLIIGMVVSLFILSFGFLFLNQIFWMTGAMLHSGWSLFGITSLSVIWFGIITAFMTNTFKIIPTLADNSLEWFLGGIARTFGNDLDNATASDFKSNAHHSTGVGTTAVVGSVGIFKAAQAGAKKKDKK